MLTGYLNKNEFVEHFLVLCTQTNCEVNSGDAKSFAEEFYDNCFNKENEDNTYNLFINTTDKFKLNREDVTPPLFQTLAFSISKICQQMNPKSINNLNFIFSTLDLLKITPEKDDSENTTGISGILRFLKNNDVTIKLLNSFKGVRVLHMVEIIRIDDNGDIIVRAHPEQIKAMEYERYTCITHKYLPQQITAKVSSIDNVSNSAVLTDLSILKKPFERRKIHRLQPETPIYADLFSDGNKIPVQIADISLRGVSLIFEESITASDSELRLIFTLPVDGGVEMALRGKIKYIFSEKVYKLGLETFPDIEQATLIKKYLHERIQGIEKELS
jgi:hypothetical protein